MRSNAINYEKFNLRSNISANVTNNLKFDLNISGMMDERESSPLIQVRLFMKDGCHHLLNRMV